MNAPAATAGVEIAVAGRQRDDHPTTATTATTATCPVCARAFRPVGRQRYCKPALPQDSTSPAPRRAAPVEVTCVPAAVGRRARTVYQCPDCEGLQLVVQRCVECLLFGRSLGLRGHCPHCDELVTLEDLDLTTA